MLSFQCQFIVNKFLGSGLFLLFGFLDLWGDPRPGWLDWIGIAAVCTAILLFLWMIVLEKKRGVEKKDEMAVHSQHHAKSDLYDWACIALLLLIVFFSKGNHPPPDRLGIPVLWLASGIGSAFVLLLRKKGGVS